MAEYTSLFHPQKLMSTVCVNPEIVYDWYDFQKTTIMIDKHGNLDKVVGLDEKIEVSKHWHSFSGGDKPEDGYLSKGGTKFAFMVCNELSHLYFSS